MADEHVLTLDEEIKNVTVGRPHLVILGAGASVHAFPKGDKNGRKLPLMNDLVEALQLESILGKHSVDYRNKNFENIFSDLYEADPKSEIIKFLEDRVRSYFSEFEIPDEPTLYDQLILSLRSKDWIATFNWDPLLYQAYIRIRESGIFQVPKLLFLHGNVLAGYCKQDRITAENKYPCPECRKPLTHSKLLYPIKRKNYSENEFIADQWNVLKQVLAEAYLLTIFGYSAPTTDIEAIDLMKSGWGDKMQRQYEEVEIIHRPGKTDDEVTAPWKDFIHSHHYMIVDDFDKSLIGTHPRRTCEVFFAQSMDVKYVLHENKPPKITDLTELVDWFNSLFEAEKVYTE